MEKYRKKSVVVYATQFASNESRDIEAIPLLHSKDWVIGFDKGIYLNIPTLEGDMKCREYDWIIQNENGEFYPCKPDIFEKNYQLVE
jgi:hypothetical protein